VNGWGYLAQTVGVGAASFLLGYLAGRTARDVHRIAETVTEQGGTVSRRAPLRHRIRTSGGQFAVAFVVIALGIVTVVQGVYQSAATRRIVTCNETYANTLADVIVARSQGSQQAQDALDDLMSVIGRLAATPPASEAEAIARREESRKAVTEYVAKRAEVKALQEKNPYPQPPRESCPR
jgi:hypothetical protein